MQSSKMFSFSILVCDLHDDVWRWHAQQPAALAAPSAQEQACSRRRRVRLPMAQASQSQQGQLGSICKSWSWLVCPCRYAGATLSARNHSQRAPYEQIIQGRSEHPAPRLSGVERRRWRRRRRRLRRLQRVRRRRGRRWRRRLHGRHGLEPGRWRRRQRAPQGRQHHASDHPPAQGRRGDSGGHLSAGRAPHPKGHSRGPHCLHQRQGVQHAVPDRGQHWVLQRLVVGGPRRAYPGL
mmetsp:Transcript_13804/g.44144  ORF Transcript_13804/g.44144 Transcript_13804/m.44144 type:complete len:237 (+) Transcript_13804:1294-2004(+)